MAENTRQIVLDTETTGLDPKEGHRLIELGCVELIDRRLQVRAVNRIVRLCHGGGVRFSRRCRLRGRRDRHLSGTSGRDSRVYRSRDGLWCRLPGRGL